jgi:hypothetical protein
MKLATFGRTTPCLEDLNCDVHPDAKIDQLETVCSRLAPSHGQDYRAVTLLSGLLYGSV